MRRYTLFGLLLWFGACVVLAQPLTTQPRAARQLQWQSIFGKDPADERRSWVLMNRGWLGMPGLGQSAATPELIQHIEAWMKAHPEAHVVPVTLCRLSQDEDGGFVYCWLVDGNENLNVELVRLGLCTAKNMGVDKYDDDLLISPTERDRCADALAAAELAAIAEKRGQWVRAGGQGEAIWERAEDLEQQGDFRAAAQEFERVATGPSADPDTARAVAAWLRAARCHDRAGAYQSALAAYDKAVPSDSDNRWFLSEKAQCMARHGDAEKAGAMFREAISASPNDLELRRACATFLHQRKDFKPAATTLEEGVQEFLKRADIKFDAEHRIVWDTARIRKANRPSSKDTYLRDTATLPLVLAELGRYCLDAAEVDQAWQYATMGLSISQRPASPKAADAKLAEAGDVSCRYVRARVFMQRASFDEAKAEIDHAKLLIDAAYLQGPGVKGELSQMYANLQARFPDRKVVIPERRPPASRPAPIDAAKTADDQLVRIAAAEDPANSFAALQELFQRATAEKLPPDAMQRLIEDGLQRQADPKAVWRGLYGNLIVLAWKRGQLTPEQIDRYARHVLVAAELTANHVAWNETTPVSASLQLNERAGSIPGDEQYPYAGMFAIIRPVAGRIDGHDVTLGDFRGQPIQSWVVAFFGGISGGNIGFCETQKLKPGEHSLSLRCQVQVKRGAPGFGLESEERSAEAPLLAEWSFELTGEFDVAEEGKTTGQSDGND